MKIAIPGMLTQFIFNEDDVNVIHAMFYLHDNMECSQYIYVIQSSLSRGSSYKYVSKNINVSDEIELA